MTHDDMTERLRDKSLSLSQEQSEEIADRMDWYHLLMLRAMPVISELLVSDGLLTKEEAGEYRVRK
jgi:hypothetical protein